jgi:hypothetical protein
MSGKKLHRESGGCSPALAFVQMFDAHLDLASRDLGGRMTRRGQADSASACAARFEILLETRTVSLPSGNQPFQQHMMAGLSDLFLKRMQGLLDELQVSHSQIVFKLHPSRWSTTSPCPLQSPCTHAFIVHAGAFSCSL